jgi:hypothetical protein
MHRLLFALALVPIVYVAGCDCAGPVTPGGTCSSSTDCPSGSACVDSHCRAAMDAGAHDVGPITSEAGADASCASGTTCSGACCAVGEVCSGGACCASDHVCAGTCCGPDEVCESDVCRLVCDAPQIACGEGAAAVCCPAGDVCLSGACTTPGAACGGVMRCPDDQYCELTLGHCLPRAMTAPCEYRPPPGTFDPSVEWAWTGDPDAVPTHNQVMMAPAIANLGDDNGDGLVDENDIPDVVFNTFSSAGVYYGDGVLRAISGSGGTRIFPASDPGYRTMPGAGVAIAELDATSPGPEILTCAPRLSGVGCCDGVVDGMIMVSAAGALLRTFPTVHCGYSAPAVADMDHDGVPEIAVRYHVVHADGVDVFSVAARDATSPASGGDLNTFADVDEDGELELVGGNSAWNMDGSPVWERTDVPDGYPAIADIDMDGRPEVVVVSSSDHSLRAFNGEDGTDVWGPFDVNQGHATGSPSGGGPPTIADFDGDGLPEIAAAGGYGYVVFENDGSPRWFAATRDLSSRVTGSSVFDFDGNGAAEVVYNDEKFLRVYDGSTGDVLLEECSTTGTLWEYPLIVDVDADEHAEIIVVSNDYGGQLCTDGSPGRHGVRAYGSATANWVRTRRIWGSHAYHVTDVNEDGTIPMSELRNWETTGLNDFRQNVQPDGALAAPDLVLQDLALDTSTCSVETRVRLRVANIGRAGAPAGVPVEIFAMDPAGGASAIGMVVTTRTLLPGESELFSVVVPIAPTPGVSFTIWATLNTGGARIDTLHECHEGDENTVSAELFCPELI